MDLTKEKRQRDEFRGILFDLADSQEKFEDQNVLTEMYERLEELYYAPAKADQFRHFYSDIFSVLTQIQEDPSRGSIDILGQNLSVIRERYDPRRFDKAGNPIDISDNIKKLYDHVNLDIARISYSEAGDRKTLGEEAIAEIRSQITYLKSEIQSSKSDQDEVKKELGKQQKEYIAILGIFAAVVLAFTGGIAFSTSVLSNIDSASPYRIVIVILVVGLVLINVLFGLFYYVDILVNGREKKSIKPLLISNLVLLLLLAGSIVCWTKGVVECRNRRVNSVPTEMEQLVETIEEKSPIE